MIDGARKQESRTSAASVMPGEWHVPSKPHSAFFGTHCPGDTGLSETRGRHQGQKGEPINATGNSETYCSLGGFLFCLRVERTVDDFLITYSLSKMGKCSRGTCCFHRNGNENISLWK